MISILSQWKIVLLPSTVLYLYLVHHLRFRRSSSLPHKYPYPDRTSYNKMTFRHAWEIHNSLIEYEFPTTFSAATMFALFKAYGIPTISSILRATGQFSSKDTVDKRYTDTGCLLLEAVLNPPASERALEAIARINYLHSPHMASGKISNDDLLYTLSLFALEPARWVKKYEWRELTNLEMCAVGTLWKLLGEALGIKYDVLGDGAELNDGLMWLEALDDWSSEYQERYMVPAESNKQVADATLYHITWKLSKKMKSVGNRVVAALLEDKLREAMMIPKPPQSYYTLINRFISARKFILLHLSLPRMRPKKRLPIASSSGRIHSRKYNIQPWYVKPTFSNRYGLKAWRTWWKGGVLPGDDGGKYFPEGFRASELGPNGLRGRGEKEMGAERSRLEELWSSERGVCPFLVQE
ncbi:uncharacterized protein LY89DRAFT_590394 [Mollisia scopiformis]|uniref:ER-bound oxygenase mpaB/mpaB'/Rubber oxygenase catalytic domain-containing protein n=1 Tax=Mollisia scopiformis TaxID=149040 RepID=A0A194X1H5_MOLSC|nr:uncharacterized protein LY89DRAFT_590394 [Mollisia scopiformis]KUJ13834.1 hypothetical protein LY89DRAFT_590394 [Mollisia scopiformis]